MVLLFGKLERWSQGRFNFLLRGCFLSHHLIWGLGTWVRSHISKTAIAGMEPGNNGPFEMGTELTFQ